jgi:hypothetical protein
MRGDAVGFDAIVNRTMLFDGPRDGADRQFPNRKQSVSLQRIGRIRHRVQDAAKQLTTSRARLASRPPLQR